MLNKYISLHNHSDFSFLDSVAKIDDLTTKAKLLGMPGLALTDHGNICGWLKFYESCKKNEIKSIFGIEAYVCDDSLLPSKIDDRIEELEQHLATSMGTLFEYAENPKAFENRKETLNIEEALGDSKIDAEGQIEFLKEYKTKIKKSNHLILLAKNKIGYNNIIKLSSYGYQKGLFYKPRIDMKILEKHKEGLIVLSACLGGQISNNILKGKIDKAEEYVKEYKRIFGEDFYLELQLHEIEEQKVVNKILIEFMKKYKIQPVITQDVHYVEKEDVELHEIVIKLRKKQKESKEEDTDQQKLKEEMEVGREDEDDSDSYFYSTKSLYFKSYDELIESFKKDHSYIHEKIFNKAIENTMIIFNKIEDIKIRSEKPLLPTFDTGNLTPRQFILNIIKEGVKEKLSKKLENNKEMQKIYEERIKEELDTICELNFEQYFLVEWDIMNFCKKNGIMTSVGRGSAAGSLIAYLLNITHLDPIFFELIFSRFINKSRSGAIYKLDLDDIKIN